ncbi:MAG: hypothetical protein HYY93_07370 [Planctomycetes bacterium]|nr:hypothetical protein [Planctomycetota bacterium]
MPEAIRNRIFESRTDPGALRENANRALRRPAGPGLPREDTARFEKRTAAARAGVGAEVRRETTGLQNREAETRAADRAENQNRPPRSRVTPDDNGRVIDIFA